MVGVFSLLGVSDLLRHSFVRELLAEEMTDDDVDLDRELDGDPLSENEADSVLECSPDGLEETDKVLGVETEYELVRCFVVESVADVESVAVDV